MVKLTQNNKNTKPLSHKILAIESSCDETAVAIYCSKAGLIANIIYSQIKIHQPYGGVVPELASRDHLAKITQLVTRALNEANLNLGEITAIAYTKGPGLAGALLVGSCFAKALALSRKIPCFGIHHMEGHLVAPMLENAQLDFPFICLLVSGGHTLLLKAKKLGNYQILGQSRDDALGEAFDKVAKMMGLSYPGGKELSKLASDYKKNKNSCDYIFPRPMINQDNLDFSFSGLKTHALQRYQASAKTQKDKQKIASAFEEAVIDVLLHKTTKALKQTGFKTLVVSGGVSANKPLKKALYQKFGKDRVYFPNPKLCSDNAAMIAYCAHLKLIYGKIKKENPSEINIKPRWPICELMN